MDSTQLIHEFTDGTLETAKEEQLFRILADNEESRGEFKQTLAMKSAINSDTKAYTPAAASTLKIFSSVGFHPPVAATIADTAGRAGAGTGFFAKHWLAFVSGLVTTVATAVVVFLLLQAQITQLQNENTMLNSSLTSALESNHHNIVVQEQNPANVKSNNNISTIQKPIIRYIYLTKKENEKIDVLQKDNLQNASLNGNLTDKLADNKSADKPDLIEIFIPAKANLSQMSMPAVTGQSNFGFTPYPLDRTFADNIQEIISSIKDMGFTIELRKMESWWDHNPIVYPKAFNKFNNSSVSLFYEFLKGLNFGAEIRQETFYQKFVGVEKDTLFQYEQQPNFLSGGFVLRYANKDWNILGIYPMLQGYFGTTNVGSISRAMFGLGYSPFRGFTMILGAEGSQLLYKHNGQSNLSNRYDLNYGISWGW